MSSERVEVPSSGQDMSETYADDRTIYYYWRRKTHQA